MVENPSEITKKQDDVRKLKEQVQEWQTSYNAPIAQRRWQKQMQDLEKLITPNDVQTFEKSDHAREAVSTLGQSMEKQKSFPPTQSEFCLVHDYLLTSICINNACRAGPLSSMTLEELEKAKHEQDSWVVTVFKHKTLKAHGPASVVLSETLHKWLVSYVRYMSIHVPGVSSRKEEFVFMSWSGKDMTTSMVSAQINSFWQKSTGNRTVRVKAAAFRKAAVSIVHMEHAHLKGPLADLMSHNPQTAETF